MNRRAKTLIAAASLAFTVVAAQADGDVQRGHKLAYTCLGCHGIENYKNAYPKYSVPKLGGQNTAYLVAALGEYKAGNRWHPTMKGLATSLTDQDRADLAVYFSSTQAAKAGTGTVGTPPAKAELCVACHGKNGQGTMDENPDIGGQHADYLAQALNDYRLGKRKNAIMAPFATQLTREDIAALSKFFSAQSGLATPAHD
jgi:cytochrome c553